MSDASKATRERNAKIIAELRQVNVLNKDATMDQVLEATQRIHENVAEIDVGDVDQAMKEGAIVTECFVVTCKVTT